MNVRMYSLIYLFNVDSDLYKELSDHGLGYVFGLLKFQGWKMKKNEDFIKAINKGDTSGKSKRK
tara:strand:+ start:721 stop:912 length:192 start_codon:yes stop_codon:yes gene_type:complete